MKTHTAVHNQGITVTRNNPLLVPKESENKVDLLIRDLYQKGTYRIHDIRVVDIY